MLDAPQRVEAERLGEVAEPQLVAVDVAVGAALALALEDDAHSDVHGGLPVATPPQHTAGYASESTSFAVERIVARRAPDAQLELAGLGDPGALLRVVEARARAAPSASAPCVARPARA